MIPVCSLPLLLPKPLPFALTRSLTNARSLARSRRTAQNGLLRLLSYLLQTLSANEPFGKSLNQTIRTPIPARWGVTGSAVDFMIVVSPSLQLYQPCTNHAHLCSLTRAVDIQHRNHPRPEPPLPSTNHLHRQHLPLHHAHRRPSLRPAVGSV